MPPLDNTSATKTKFLRQLIYGAAKTKKTWWACKAAEFGFAVTLIDIDDGAHILSQIKPEARHLINVIDAVDKFNDATGAVFMTLLLRGDPFIWNETKKEPHRFGECDPECAYYVIDPKLLGPNDIVVPDSWTELCTSVAHRFSIENNIDLSDADKTDWDGYGWTGRLASWWLHQMHALPCHLILVGHEDIYEKKKIDKRSNKVTVEWVRTQVKSTSGPHSKAVPVGFSDVLHFTTTGQTWSINTGGGSDRDGGSRLMAPKKYNWEDLNVSDFAKLLGFEGTGKETKAFVYYKSGTDVPVPEKKTKSLVQMAPKVIGPETKAKPSSLTGLLGAKKIMQT